jgi:molybdate transport system permease protein
VRRSPLTYLGAILALGLLVPLVAFAVRFAVSRDRGFEAAGLGEAFATSVATASVSTAIIVVLGVPLAYVLARSPGRLSRAVGVLVQLPLALPPVMSGIVLIYVVGPYTLLGSLFGGGLTSSFAGIVIAQTFVASPFLVIAARSAFQALDPALDDLAATLGHRPLARFLRVALPAASGGVAAGILLTWLRALGEYGATVLLAYHPYSLPVFTNVQFQAAGVPGTQAPTALALGIAIVAVLVVPVAVGAGRRALRRARSAGASRATIDAVAPAAREPTPVSFALDTRVGGFRLELAHESRSHRIAILGPSGSGKSLTLRAIAGLVGSAGAVRFGGVSVDPDPAERRHVGYVPQGGTLLPGRTVREQLLFGVDADARVAAWWLDTLRLTGLEGRLPDELSGGQRQRVALASALSRRPRGVLLDEPFSALDAPVRDELRLELRRLQRDTGLSTVLVTHDPEEAALLADEILVIADGRLLQAGSRAEVYGRPASPEVARLLGIENLLRGTAGAGSTVRAEGAVVECAPHALRPGSPVLWSVRPERIRLGGTGTHRVTILDMADIGTSTRIAVRLADGPALRVRATGPVSVAPGDRAWITIDPADCVVWAAPEAPVA